MTMRGDLKALIAFKTKALKQMCDYNSKGLFFWTGEKRHSFWCEVHGACLRQMNEVL